MSQLDIVVTAYNEAENLPRLLESLRQQTVDCFRLLLVDNASTDATPQIAAEATGITVEVIHEPQPGISYARNAGYQAARTPYVAFTDADMKVHPQWVETILTIAERDAPLAFGGPYYPYYIAPKPDWYRDLYNTKHLGDEPRDLSDHEYLSGGNMVWRRDILVQLGGFRPDMGVTKRGIGRGEETNLQIRARRDILGFTARYYPDVIVYHLTRPKMYSLWYWARVMLTSGLRHDEMWEAASERSYARTLMKAARSALRFGWGVTGGALRRDRVRFPYWQNYFYEHVKFDLYQLGQHIGRL